MIYVNPQSITMIRAINGGYEYQTKVIHIRNQNTPTGILRLARPNDGVEPLRDRETLTAVYCIEGRDYTPVDELLTIGDGTPRFWVDILHVSNRAEIENLLRN